MIAVIGGAKTTVRVRIIPPKEDGEGNIIAKEEGKDEIEVISSGCGFNIAKHLADCGSDVAYISVVGNDLMGPAIIEDLKACGINADGVKMVQGTTPIQMEMLNILGDLADVKSNETLAENITPEFVEANKAILEKAEIIVMDGSLPVETIETVAQQYGEKAKIFFDPAKRSNGSKIKNVFDKIYCVMPGRMEAEEMTGMGILGQDQLMAAGAYLDEKGVDRIVITMKGGGVYYKEGLSEGILRPDKVLSFAQTTGAGDVVSAAVIMGTVNGKDIETTATEAMACAAQFLADRSDERPIDIYK